MGADKSLALDPDHTKHHFAQACMDRTMCRSGEDDHVPRIRVVQIVRIVQMIDSETFTERSGEDEHVLRIRVVQMIDSKTFTEWSGEDEHVLRIRFVRITDPTTYADRSNPTDYRGLTVFGSCGSYGS